jgi:hypothetical protein
MSRCLKHPNNELSSGWIYVHPETRKIIRGRTFPELVEAAKEYAREHNFPIGSEFSRQLEEAVCDDAPSLCKECQVEGEPIKVTAGMVLRGTKTMIAFLVAGRPVVDQPEATRRAGLCYRCPKRSRFRTSCGGLCNEMKRIVDRIVGTRVTGVELGLSACGICHCFLSASVWLPLDVQCQGVNDAQRSGFAKVRETYPCWKEC